MQIMLVFPHQLFIQPRENTRFVFIEDNRFFDNGITYHKHKLILHRASMMATYHTLDADKVYYRYPVDHKTLSEEFQSASRILAYDPIDHRLKSAYNAYGITWLDSPNFLTDHSTLTDYFGTHKKYYMHDFYRFQRKRLNILMNGESPVGDKWSFDQENRHALPKDIEIPAPLIFDKNPYLDDAKAFVNEYFPNNPGNTEMFNHPTTRKEAKQQLQYFLDYKFKNFGAYQDALSTKDPYLFHANISSSLNIGLLSPEEIIVAALKKEVPLASKEGFIRQIIGWREFIRALYILEGESMRKKNFLNHQEKLSEHWYHSTIGIPVVDQTLEKLQNHAYSHHIERLMILGNLMMLLNVAPNEVYKFFMSMHIDAYDWVMVPNIYGMSQFASGPLMTTKPYFSGANYLRKMGVSKGQWETTWNALFYLFLEKHRKIIESNPRLRMLIKHLDNKSKDTMDHYRKLQTDIKEIAIKRN